MAKKSLGYMELEWTCPNCDTKNPGMQKTCISCGSPQPENVQFGLGEQQELIKDTSKVAQVQKGADFHCPYCGTRNPVDATSCSQCGGDLTGGAQRVSGRVIAGAPNTPQAGVPVGINSPQTAKPSKFRPWMLLPVAACVIGACILFGFLVFRTEKSTGIVQNVNWEHVVFIQELRNVTREDWEDQVPSNADVISCDLKYRTRQDSPAANATEVCSTQLVDQGNGAAEVVEDCYYEVYENSCSYTAQEWQQVDQALAQGNDLNPYWPDANLALGQREGDHKATYTVQFQTDKGLKEYTTDNEDLFRQFQPGSTWTLEINTLGAVVSVQP